MDERHLMPFQGSFQLTFFNQLQVERSILLDLFQEFGSVKPESKIYSGIKRRCFIHYQTPAEALGALEGLKSCNLLHNLEVAPDCLRPEQIEVRGGPEEDNIFPCLGTYDLTYTTDRYNNIESLRDIFSEFGTVESVLRDFRPVRGRTRVFVKFRYKSGALLALRSLRSTFKRSLRSTFKDLCVARNCTAEANRGSELPPDNKGFYCVRFKNCDQAGSEILTRPEVIELFNQYGAVQSVYRDSKKWCYIRYPSAEAAATAVYELGAAGGPLPGVGYATSRDQRAVFKKKIRDPPIESPLELLVSNYPHSTSSPGLATAFSAIHSIRVREMIVEGRKAYAFARVDSLEEMKLAVKLYHNTLLGGRRIKVMAKLPKLQAKIMAELDSEQSCTMNLSSNRPPSNSSSDDPTEEGLSERVQLFDCFSELNVSDDEGNGLYCTVPHATTKQHLEMDENKFVDVGFANFSQGTTKEDIELLLIDYYVTVRLGDKASCEEFTYSLVRFYREKDAREAILKFDGSANLGSSNLILERT